MSKHRRQKHEAVIWQSMKIASGTCHETETFSKQSYKNLPECEVVIKQDEKGALKTDKTLAEELVFHTGETKFPPRLPTVFLCSQECFINCFIKCL